MTTRARVGLVLLITAVLVALAMHGAADYQRAHQACAASGGHWSTDLDECVQ